LQTQLFAEAEELQNELRARLSAQRAEALCEIMLFHYGNEGRRGLRQSSLVVLQISLRQREATPQARFRFQCSRQQDTRLSRRSSVDRPNAKTSAHHQRT
jgi:hypothetical protein